MKTVRQVKREAKRLFHSCLVAGSLDEDRARRAVHGLIAAGRPGTLPVLSRFHRLVRLDRSMRAIEVQSAEPLPADTRRKLEADLASLYGRDIIASFTSDPQLIAGLRITVGSMVYDGTVRGRLAALEAQL